MVVRESGKNWHILLLALVNLLAGVGAMMMRESGKNLVDSVVGAAVATAELKVMQGVKGSEMGMVAS